MNAPSAPARLPTAKWYPDSRTLQPHSVEAAVRFRSYLGGSEASDRPDAYRSSSYSLVQVSGISAKAAAAQVVLRYEMLRLFQNPACHVQSRNGGWSSNCILTQRAERPPVDDLTGSVSSRPFRDGVSGTKQKADSFLGSLLKIISFR